MIQVNNREVVKPVNWTTNTIVQRSRLYQTPVKSKIQMKAGNTKQRPKTQPTIKGTNKRNSHTYTSNCSKLEYESFNSFSRIVEKSIGCSIISW